jgi:predicted porin
VFQPTGLLAYDNQAYMFGLTVPLLGGSLLGSYQYSDADNVNGVNAAGPYAFEPDYSVWGVGYSYPFSRRTNLYIGYGQQEWDGTVSQVTSPAAPSQRIDRKQFALGVRHLF